MLAITGYACAVPRARVPAAALPAPARGLRAKRVADVDEDALTLGLNAARAAMNGASPRALALASTSLPYRRRVQAGLLVEALGLSHSGTLVTEHTTSARAATEALVLHARGDVPVLLVAAETATGPVPGQDDGSLGAAAAALLLAPAADDGVAARIIGTAHHTAEDPGLDFTLAGEETRHDIDVPPYAAMVGQAAVAGVVDGLLAALGHRAEDYRFAVIAGVHARVAGRLAAAAGFERGQTEPCSPYPELGDIGAAAPLVGLAMALDAARPGDRILVVAYGAGSAADAVSLEAGDGAGAGVVERALAGAHDIDTLTYLRLRGAI